MCFIQEARNFTRPFIVIVLMSMHLFLGFTLSWHHRSYNCMQSEREHSFSCIMAEYHDKGNLAVFVSYRIYGLSNLLPFPP